MKLMNKSLMLDPGYIDMYSNFEWITRSLQESINYSIENGVAVISIHGLLTKRSEFFENTVGYEEIRESIGRALIDDQVDSILLDIDSPGGEVGGLFDLVDYIFKSRNLKPIYAYANDSAFSAAYAIASACSKVFINRTSGVGSIGVIATHVDVSGADKKEGVTYTTIFAGDKKADLNIHEPLSERAKDSLQAEVNRLYEMFVSIVSRNRDLHVDLVRATQAASYFGNDCINIGLADEITSDPVDYIKKFGAMPCISKVQLKGDVLMTDDIVDEKPSEIEIYQKKILEIVKLCRIARADSMVFEFIQNNFSVDEVKEKLLALSKSQEEISGIHGHKVACDDNPVIAAAKKIAKIK